MVGPSGIENVRFGIDQNTRPPENSLSKLADHDFALLSERLRKRTSQVSEEPPTPEAGTLANHLEHLAVEVDDVIALLNRQHEEGEIHPEALPRVEHVSTSLRDVIHALTHHDHLAMTGDDVWTALTLKHKKQTDGTVN